MSKVIVFSPSEFAFGYSGCKRCYYDLKVNDLKIQTGFPSIFSKLHSFTFMLIKELNSLSRNFFILAFCLVLLEKNPKSILVAFLKIVPN